MLIELIVSLESTGVCTISEKKNSIMFVKYFEGEMCYLNDTLSLVIAILQYASRNNHGT